MKARETHIAVSMNGVSSGLWHSKETLIKGGWEEKEIALFREVLPVSIDVGAKEREETILDLDQKISEMNLHMSGLNQIIKSNREELTRLRDALGKAREDFLLHGLHKDQCADIPDDECICGLSEALTAIDKALEGK